MKLINFLKLSVTTVILASCGSDDNNEVIPENGGGLTPKFDVPATYVFENDKGVSTVDFNGQTTRLFQGSEILNDFVTFGTTKETLDRKFTDGEGFTDASLSNGKKIKGKVAETFDSVTQAEIRGVFDGYIADQVAILLSQYKDVDAVPEASIGNVGKLGKRLVNANGLELNQAFNKGLIGALTLDQIVNDYLTLTERPSEQAANTAGTPDGDGKPYTTAEHHWDEAYGYLYGASDPDVLDNPDSRHLVRDNVEDKFLYKYVQRVEEDADFKGTANKIFQAFKTGRAAIVANEYEESKKQADIIRKTLSEVVGIRAVFYLKEGARRLGADGLGAIIDGTAFHDLSEGYGFVYSLQFTNNPDTGEAYFTPAQVNDFIARLDANNGFWKYADDQTGLDTLANEIAAQFDFTVAQAESTKAVQ